jgi:hypothetical protein
MVKNTFFLCSTAASKCTVVVHGRGADTATATGGNLISMMFKLNTSVQ